jgi:hypothetical protein
VAVLIGLADAAVRPPSRGANMWDLYFVEATNTQIVGMATLVVWTVVVLRGSANARRPDALIRHGSHTAAAVAHLREAGGAAAAAIMLANIAYLLIALPSGIGWSWSSATRQSMQHTDLILVIGPTSLAGSLESPLLAAVLQAVYLLVGLLVLAAAHHALAISAPRIAGAFLMSFAGLTAIASFGVLTSMPLLDPTPLFNLAWALGWQRLLGALVVTAAMLTCTALLLVRADRSTTGLVGWLSSGWGSVVVIGCALVTLAPTITGTGEVRTALPLPGRFGSIDDYARTLLLPIGTATVFYAWLTTRTTEYLTYDVIRRGNYGRWMTAATIRGTALTALATGGAALILLTQQQDPRSLRNVGAVAILVAAQTLFYCALALLLFWLAPIDVAWPITVGGSLVLGYPFVVDLGPLNIFAGLSINPATPGVDLSAALAPAVAAFVLLATAHLVTRTTAPAVFR